MNRLRQKAWMKVLKRKLAKNNLHVEYCWDCRDEMNLNRVKNFKENNEINVSSRKTPDPQTLDT